MSCRRSLLDALRSERRLFPSVRLDTDGDAPRLFAFAGRGAPGRPIQQRLQDLAARGDWLKEARVDRIVDATRLTSAERDAILGGNAARILHIAMQLRRGRLVQIHAADRASDFVIAGDDAFGGKGDDHLGADLQSRCADRECRHAPP